MAEVKIRMPKGFAKGDVINVRALVAHPMEVVERDKEGKPVDRVYNYVHKVSIAFNGKEYMQGEMTQSLSANPFIEFPLKVTGPGTLTVTFEDTTGEKHAGSVEVAP